MTTLTINDLSRNEEMDRKAMADVHGGYTEHAAAQGQPEGILDITTPPNKKGEGKAASAEITLYHEGFTFAMG